MSELESQCTTHSTTAISTDYLHLIVDAFQRSLAAGQTPPIHWTEALRHEHEVVVRKIRDGGVSSTSPANSLPLHQRSDSGGSLHHASRRSQTALPRGPNPSTIHQSHTQIPPSTREIEVDEIILFGNNIGSRARLSILPDSDIILVERTRKLVGTLDHAEIPHLNVVKAQEKFTLGSSGTGYHNSPTFGKVAHRCEGDAEQPFYIRAHQLQQSVLPYSCISCDIHTPKDGPFHTESTNLEVVIARVKNVLCDYSEHLRQDDRGTQLILDELQTLLNHSASDVSELRETLLSTLLRVSRQTNIYPSNFSLTHIVVEGEQPVAHGSFGDIYKGRLRDRTVCLKVLKTYKQSDTMALNKAFSREAYIWSRLSHINVVPFYGVYNIDHSRLALVSPWIENGNINNFLRANPDADRPLLVSDVADGLSYLHQNHIVHGDLKGGNILVTASHRACLADFGLSRITANRETLPSSGVPDGGTLRWQAPELMDPQLEAPKSQASDVYAFAFACYEIFTGKNPFPEVIHDFAVMLKVVRGERPSRPPNAFGLIDEIWSLMEDCWHHSPQHRPMASEIVKSLSPHVANRKRANRLSWEVIPIGPAVSACRYCEDKELSNKHVSEALEHILKVVVYHDPRTESFSTLATEKPALERLAPSRSLTLDEGCLEPSPQNITESFELLPAGIREVNTNIRTGSSDILTTGESPTSSSGVCGEPSHIVERLSGIFGNLDRYKQVLHSPRSKSHSQGLLDLFQKLLGNPKLGWQFRHNLVIATQRLAKSSDLYPNCFGLDDVASIEEHPVAAGSFADIHKGTINNKEVCLKVIRLYQASRVDYVLKRFYQEAILWGQLSHPNLLPFYGLYRFRNRLCLVSPWAKNGDINNYLERNPSIDRALLALDIAAGMAYLHANDIVHGDLKGSNILVDESGRARLADFGLSAVTDPKILKWTSQSSAASKGGSIRWQAPELFGAESDELVPNSKASDVYAWACVCYEIFTGDVPFFEFGRDSTVMLKVGLGKRPSRPPSTSQSWDAWGLTEVIWSLMDTCWKEDPAGRPCAEMIVAQLSSAMAKDTRPLESWHDFASSQLQEAVGEYEYPSIDALEAMLWGTSTLNEI